VPPQNPWGSVQDPAAHGAGAEPELAGGRGVGGGRERLGGVGELLLELQQLANKTGAVLNSHQEVGVIFTMLQVDETLPAFERAVALLQKDQQLPMKASTWLAESLSKQASTVDDAYYLLETRKTEGEAVPIAAVNLVIEACAIMGDLDRAFATWAELEQLALKPNTGTYNALLHACVRTREVASGRRLLTRMEMDEVDPDPQTFDHRCSLLVMSRQGNAAVELLAECQAAGFKPLSKMYVTCVNHLVRQQRHDDVRALLGQCERITRLWSIPSGWRGLRESFGSKRCALFRRPCITPYPYPENPPTLAGVYIA